MAKEKMEFGEEIERLLEQAAEANRSFIQGIVEIVIYEKNSPAVLDEFNKNSSMLFDAAKDGFKEGYLLFQKIKDEQNRPNMYAYVRPYISREVNKMIESVLELEKIYGEKRVSLKGGAGVNGLESPLFSDEYGAGDDLLVEDFIPSDAIDPLEKAIEAEQVEHLQKYINGGVLTPEEKQVLMLKYGFEDKEFSVREICEKTQLPPETINRILSSAIKKLQEAFLAEEERGI